MENESTEDTQTEPTTQDLDNLEQQLRDKFDENPAAVFNEGEPEPQKEEPGVKPDAATDTKDDPEPSGRNEKGQFVKKEQAPDKVEGEPPQKAESKYEKAKKDQIRYDRNFQKLNERSEAVKRKEEELSQREQEIQDRFRRQQEDAQRQSEGRFSPAEFERAADWHDQEAVKAANEGDIEKFQKLTGDAKELRKAARDTYVKQQQRSLTDLGQKWGENADRLIAEHKDLQDENSEAYKGVMKILDKNQFLLGVPDGFQKACEYYQAHQKGLKYDEAITRAEKAEAEVERLNKLTQPASGSPSTPAESTEKFEGKSLDEMENTLRNRVYQGEALVR